MLCPPMLGLFFIDWEKHLIDALLCVVRSTLVEHTGNLLGFQLAGD